MTAFAALLALAAASAPAVPDGFAVVKVTPPDGARDVAPDAVVQIHVSRRFDPATVTAESVWLRHGRDRVAVTILSDLGGVITLAPEAPLRPYAEYTVEVGPALKSADGAAIARFVSRFHIGAGRAPIRRTLPPFRKTPIASEPGVTSLTLGPDGSLYATTWEGRLLRWPIDPASGRPSAGAVEVWHAPGTRITGLCFDPDAQTNRQIWIAFDDNAGASVCPLRFSARIARLTLSDDGAPPVVRDVITGLPVGDHAVSGLTFGPDGRLYFFCGAITMLGADKPGARETPLSAAVLAADVRAVAKAEAEAVDVNTDPPRSYRPYAPETPVTVFATGIREAYGLCWHSNGSLYAGVNQNDTAETTPANPSRGLPAVSVRADEPLIRIVEGGYYGHPNPSRDEWVLLGGNPTAGPDPWEVPELPVGTLPEPRFDPSRLIFNLVPIGGQSADGCEEWRGDGPLKGRLLICFYTTARTVHTFAFSDDGTRVVAEEPLTDAAGSPLKFGGPLDLCLDAARGRIYVVDFADPRRKDSAGEGRIWLVEPDPEAAANPR